MNQESKPSTFVTKIDLKLAPKLENDLIGQGFAISKPQYTLFSGKKKGVVCTLYQSGKLMVQGKGTPEFMEFYLEPEILQSFAYTYEELEIDQNARIGIDEAGKGDFFGPLCVAGVFASGPEILDLKKIGVKDSKRMSDGTIHKIAKSIKEKYRHHLVKINPVKYNELILKFKNLNRLLAWGHATAIANLAEATGCKEVIIDQFAAEHVVETALNKKGVELNLTQRTKGEEDIVVAAASILARDAFLNGLEFLGKDAGLDLPKGASSETIRVGKILFEKMGLDGLGRFAKLHFKTIDAIKGEE